MAMSNKVDMNVFLHSLLVIKQMNNFTVLEAKEALLKGHAEFTDDVEARKYIYRQLTRSTEKGLLKRTDCFESGSKQVIYSKTDKLLASSIVPIKRRSRKKKITIRKEPVKVAKKISYEAELKKELLAYEIDLNTTLEEAKEYNRLSERFPELQEKLKEHQSQAKDKSIKLLGKINALQNLLSYTVTGYKAC
jgi:hypothetical protein